MTKHSGAAIASLAAGALLAATVAAAGQETAPRPGATPDQGARPEQGATPDQGARPGQGAIPEQVIKPDQAGKGTTGGAVKSQGRIDKLVRIDQQLSVPTENGCTYTANLKGNVKPAKGGATTTGPEQKVDADLIIAGVLRCPNGTDLKIADQRITRAGVTRADLVNEMQIRGSMLSTAAGPPCLYMPDLDLGADGKVQLDGVTYLCPAPHGGITPPKQP